MATTQTTGVTIKAKVDGANELAKLAKANDALALSLGKANKKLEEQAAKASVAKKSNDNVGNALANGIGNTALAINQIGEVIQKLDQWSQRSNQLSGVQANFTGNLEKLRTASRGLVTDFDLMRLSNQAMALGVAKTPKDMEALVAAADRLAAKMGTDVPSAMDSLLAGVGRGSTEMLDNLGIVLKQEQAQDRYSAALGKTRDQLTQQEKAEAFRIEAMKAITKAAGEVKLGADDAALSMAQLATQIKNAADNALMLPKHVGDLAVELGDIVGLNMRATAEMAKQSSAEAEILALAEERAGWYQQFNASIGDLIGLEEYEARLIRDNVGDIEKAAIMVRERAHEEAKVRFELEKQAGELQGKILPAMDHALGRAYELKNAWTGLGQPTSLVSLALTGAGKATQAANEYTKEWDWSTKKVHGSAKRVKDVLDEIGGMYQYTTSFADIQVQAAKDEVAAEERLLEIAMRKAQLATMGDENARPLEMLAQQERISQRKLEIAKAEVDFSRHAELEAQSQHEREMARMDAIAARREWDMQQREKLAQRHAENEATVVEASRNTVSSLAGLATARKKDAVGAAKIEQAAAAVGLTIDGQQYAAKAGAAFAALRPGQGVAFAAASAFSFAKAAEIATRPVNLGGGGGGGGGGVSTGASAPATSNAPTTQAPPTSDIPGSGGGLNRPGLDTGGGVTIEAGAITVLGAIDDKAAEKIVQGIERLKRTKRLAA